MVGDVLETSKSIQITAIVVSCKPELDNKNILLKTPHILVTRLGVISLVPAGSFLLLLAFKIVKVLFVVRRMHQQPYPFVSPVSHNNDRMAEYS